MSHNGSQEAPQGSASLPSVPAMPNVPPEPVYRGRPFLLLEYDVRHSLGWRHDRKAGPGFVVVRRSRLGTVKITDRFPLTEPGWASAWRALSDRDADAAAAIAATLAAREASTRAAAALSALDAGSLRHLRWVIFKGGSGEVPLAKGRTYDMRFLSDRITVCRPGSADAIVEVPYSDVETVEVGGPGQVSLSPGAVLAVVLALGLLGTVPGLIVHSLLVLLLGAIILGFLGALLCAAQTKIETIVRIRSSDVELHFLHTAMSPDALRVELSEALRAIRNSRFERANDSRETAEPGSGSTSDQLSKLASLLQQDLITRDEFEHLKAKLIAQS